jgi:hypothetical protein
MGRRRGWAVSWSKGGATTLVIPPPKPRMIRDPTYIPTDVENALTKAPMI